mgnify:CR=1 FL=1
MAAKKKVETTKSKQRNVAVEVPLPDGCMSMYVGRIMSEDESHIVLVDAAWIADTGRRSEFFAGRFDDRCEIEPLLDGQRVRLPARGAIITDWPHPLLRSVR